MRWLLVVGLCTLAVATSAIAVWGVGHRVLRPVIAPMPEPEPVAPTHEKKLVSVTSAIDGMAAVDGPTHGPSTWVYWTVRSEGSVWRVDGDGQRKESIATREAFPTDMVADASNVYWVNESFDTAAIPHAKNGGIRARVASGEVADIVRGNVSAGSKLAIGLASETFGTVLFFSDPARDEIDRVIVPALVPGPQTPVAIVRKAGFVISADLAADATYVYWTAGSSIMKAPIAGGAPTPVASSRRPSHLFLFHDALYWRRAAADELVDMRRASRSSTSWLPAPCQ